MLFKPKFWRRVKRKFRCGVKQGSPLNKKTPWWNKATWWRRHPEPFAKTKRGKERRAERRFLRQHEEWRV